jgi:hypothetical protein
MPRQLIHCLFARELSAPQMQIQVLASQQQWLEMIVSLDLQILEQQPGHLLPELQMFVDLL